MDSRRSLCTPQFAFGAFIMIAGIVLLLDQLHIVDAEVIGRIWPIGLILFGVAVVWRGPSRIEPVEVEPDPQLDPRAARRARRRRDHESASRFWGVIMIVVGAWLLLRNLNIIVVGFWEVFWPVMLMLFGGSIVLRALREGGHWSGPASSLPSGAPRLFAFFSGSKQALDGQPFEGASMTAMLGGCHLDLRRAILRPGEERTIDVFAFMGGHDIRVPAEWSVVVHAFPFLGGIEDKRGHVIAPPPLSGDAPPRVIIRGMVMLGGVEIKD